MSVQQQQQQQPGVPSTLPPEFENLKTLLEETYNMVTILKNQKVKLIADLQTQQGNSASLTQQLAIVTADKNVTQAELDQLKQTAKQTDDNIVSLKVELGEVSQLQIDCERFKTEANASVAKMIGVATQTNDMLKGLIPQPPQPPPPPPPVQQAFGRRVRRYH